MEFYDSNLFITKIELLRDRIQSYEEYPFNIEIIKKFNELKLSKPVSFFIGENGIGKSTFIEALAIACGLNPEGGTENFHFKTKDTHSQLHNYLRVSKFKKPIRKFFLRAETFYNFSSDVDKIAESDTSIYDYYGGKSLHDCSHGEAFLQLMHYKFKEKGLYILDEPEAALSPQRQMTLLCYINQLVKSNSQFIISTHSPIIISYPNAEIFDLNNNFERLEFEDTEIYQIYKNYINNYKKMQERLFD